MRKEQRFNLQEPPAGTDDDIKLLPILELCQSNYQEVWIGKFLSTITPIKRNDIEIMHLTLGKCLEVDLKNSF